MHERLCVLGVSRGLVYTDHGLTVINRARPGLDPALATVRQSDELVVPQLDRLAQSGPDARAIHRSVGGKGAKLGLQTSIHDPTDRMGKMFFTFLAPTAAVEADPIRLRKGGHGYRAGAGQIPCKAAETF